VPAETVQGTNLRTDLLLLQQTAGNRATTGWLRSLAPTARAPSSVQRRVGDARKYITQQKLNLDTKGLNRKQVEAYVQNPANPEDLREGLRRAWNQDQHPAQRIEEPAALGPASSVPGSTGSTSEGPEPGTDAEATAGDSPAPKVVAQPSLLSTLQAGLEQAPAPSSPEAEQPSPEAEEHPSGRVYSVRDATQMVTQGDEVDSVIHEIAVQLTAVFEREVPLFTAGIPDATVVAAPQLSGNKLKQQKEMVARAKPRVTAPRQPAASSSDSSENKARTRDPEETFFRERRQKLTSPTLGVSATAMLRVLRKITRLYQLAFRSASDHPLGKNVFSYLGADYVVNRESYVRPYDSSFATAETKGYVEVPQDAFAAFDYPANALSRDELRRTVQCILREEVPPVSARQMTVFIAAVAAETTRYGPQIASVMLALSGVTDKVVSDQPSIFTEGLTMTTGSTDPGGGKHADTRAGFKDQEKATAATSAAAIREGALIVAAFSRPEVGLDVRAHIGARLAGQQNRTNEETKALKTELASSLAARLVSLINLRSLDANDDQGNIIKLNSEVSAEAMRRHFPTDQNFSARSVGTDSIVILDEAESQQLAYDLRKRAKGKFRSFGNYLVISKTSGKIQIGRAHIKLSALTGSLIDHWEGQDWLGEPRSVTANTVQNEIDADRSKRPRPPSPNTADESKRIELVVATIQNLPETDRPKLMAQLQHVLDGRTHVDPAVQRRASLLFADIERILATEKKPTAKTFSDLFLEWMPSNEWNLMPAGWLRGEASGVAHNCLIDSLLQLTTDLDSTQRSEEAALIRYRLIEFGLTRPMEFLVGHEHIAPILTLIGVDPPLYQVRTEWTYGGERKLGEVEGTGTYVLRLWNTGGHYEPITIAANVDSGDLKGDETNAVPKRTGRPLWMPLLRQRLGPALADEKEAVKGERATKPTDSQTRPASPEAGTLDLSGPAEEWMVNMSGDAGKTVYTFTHRNLDEKPGDADLTQLFLAILFPALRAAYSVTQKDFTTRQATARICYGSTAYRYDGKKGWVKT
jgi:hypothetical protein